MSALKFLTRLADGTIKSIAAIVSSAGVGSANKIIATGSDGKISATFLPPGVEVQVELATASEALDAGDFVNIFDDNGSRGVRKAIASDLNKPAHGFVISSVASAAEASVYTKGVNTAVAGVENTKYFLSSVTAGDATDTAPTDTADHFQQVLGYGTGGGILYEFDDYIVFG